MTGWAASGFVLRESQLVAERASHVHEHVAVFVSEGGFERCAELAAFSVGSIVSLEQRLDAVRVKGPVVVIVVVVHPQLVGSIGVIFSVGRVHRRSVALFRFGELSGIMVLHVWIEHVRRAAVQLGTRSGARIRVMQRRKGDAISVGIPRAQRPTFRRYSERDRGALRKSEHCSTDIVCFRSALRVRRVGGTPVGFFDTGLAWFARAVAVPVFAAAVAARAVLR
eukprot:1876174-Pleurochrysis_carterae.AAC.1